MAESTHIDALDQALQALLAGREVLPVDAALAPLVAIARDLRSLPRPDFKARLQSELERKHPMATTTTTTVQTVESVQTLVPYIAVRRAEDLVAFVRQAFGAVGEIKGTGSQGGIHAEFMIGDAQLMIGGGANWKKENPERPTGLHFYVPNVDEVYARALAAGATSLHPPVDQPYGDREASVLDVAGNHWYIATHLATGDRPAGFRAVTSFLHPRSSQQLIAFLERAFGAEDAQVHRVGTAVVHATVRIGNSMLEMGDAHGPWQPMPTSFFMNVADVDAAYRQAIGAGASSTTEPADAPYGFRMGAVRDAEDNEWYLAGPIKGEK